MEKEIINEFLTKYTCRGISWYTVRLDNGKYISTQTPDNISEYEMKMQFSTPEAALCRDHVRISNLVDKYGFFTRKFENLFCLFVRLDR